MSAPPARSPHARPWPGPAMLVLAGLLPGVPAARAAPAPCAASDGGRLRLAAVEARGDLVFASGLRGRLSGIRWPEETAAGEAARAFLAAHVGRDLALTRRGEADRWGRVPLDALPEATEPERAEADLAGGLVAAGLAAVDAGEDDALCRPGLLVAEAGARAAGRGLWAGRSPLDALDGTGLAAAIGRFALVEGRVRGVGERRTRTYLNFAPPDGQGLTVTMTRRTWRRLAERGLDAAALRGRRVRARGVIEAWRGPTLDLATADLLEVLDARASGDGRDQGRARRR